MSDLAGAASALKELVPLVIVLVGVGVAMLALKDGSIQGASGALIVLIVGAMMMPLLMRSLSLIETGEFPSDETRQEERFNFTVMSKGIEYERGFFGPKKRYILILSDGEKYPVPREVYDLYDTGDPVTITISANRREVTFR